MSALSEMPVVTVEQVMRFRDAAIDIERQRGELLAALEEVRRDAIMVRDGRFVDMRTVVEELDAAIAKVTT